MRRLGYSLVGERGARSNLLREQTVPADAMGKLRCYGEPPPDSDFAREQEARIEAHTRRVEADLLRLDRVREAAGKGRAVPVTPQDRQALRRRADFGRRRLFGHVVYFRRPRPGVWYWRLADWPHLRSSEGPYPTRQEAVKDAALWLWKQRPRVARQPRQAA